MNDGDGTNKGVGQGKKGLGLILIIIGVLANNYIYLHDLVLYKHEVTYPGGMMYMISLGLKSYSAIVVTLIVIVIGVVFLVRESGSRRMD